MFAPLAVRWGFAAKDVSALSKNVGGGRRREPAPLGADRLPLVAALKTSFETCSTFHRYRWQRIGAAPQTRMSTLCVGRAISEHYQPHTEMDLQMKNQLVRDHGVGCQVYGYYVGGGFEDLAGLGGVQFDAELGRVYYDAQVAVVGGVVVFEEHGGAYGDRSARRSGDRGQGRVASVAADDVGISADLLTVRANL